MAEPLASLLTTSRSAANQTSYITASISPTPSRVLLAHVVSDRDVSGTSEEATLTGGGVATWSVAHSAVNVIGTRRSTWFRALTGASPTSGEVSITFAGQSQNYCMWSIVEVVDALLTGTNGADAVVQAATAGATSTAPLGTFGSAWGAADNRALVAIAYLSSSITLTPGTGFTSVTFTQGGGTPSGALIVLSGRDGSSLDCDGTLSASTSWLVHAIELAGGAGGAPPSGGAGSGARRGGWFGR